MHHITHKVINLHSNDDNFNWNDFMSDAQEMQCQAYEERLEHAIRHTETSCSYAYISNEGQPKFANSLKFAQGLAFDNSLIQQIE